MGLCPFHDERLRAARQVPLQNLQRSDIDERLVFRIERVEMRRRVRPLSLDEAEMLLHAREAAVDRAHNAEQAVERLRVLAQRGGVLIEGMALFRLHAFDIGDVGTDEPKLLQDQVCGFVSHISTLN
jgi:hypothetical protein